MSPQSAQTPAEAKQRTPSIFALVVLAVISMIVLQRLKTNDFEAAARTDDALRRIVMLPKSALPDQIDQWTLAEFSGADPDKRPSGQGFLSHQWQFQGQTSNCLVAFDQSNWHDWHELTECYRSAGWTLKSRRLHTFTGYPDWPSTVATFSKDNLHATLAFSLCFRDGLPLTSPDISADEAFGSNWLQRMQARSKFTTSQGHPDPNMLAVQFQVFSVSESEFSEDATQDLVELHQWTRSHLIEAIKAQSAETPKKASLNGTVP